MNGSMDVLMDEMDFILLGFVKFLYRAFVIVRCSYISQSLKVNYSSRTSSSVLWPRAQELPFVGPGARRAPAKHSPRCFSEGRIWR